jgi:hypothetical protein
MTQPEHVFTSSPDPIERRSMLMTLDEALAKLDEVRVAMHEQFEDEVGTHQARLAQFDTGLATVAMAVTHLHDEELREVDLARRIVDEEPVHNGEPARSPNLGKHRRDYRVAAGRA